MVPLAAGYVVVVAFPFSDLSNAKRRPAVVLAHAGRSDWVLCQVTSRAYSDLRAVEIAGTDFHTGSLERVSYARPGKLFTAHESLLLSSVGQLRAPSLDRILDTLFELLRPVG